MLLHANSEDPDRLGTNVILLVFSYWRLFFIKKRAINKFIKVHFSLYTKSARSTTAAPTKEMF